MPSKETVKKMCKMFYLKHFAHVSKRFVTYMLHHAKYYLIKSTLLLRKASSDAPFNMPF